MVRALGKPDPYWAWGMWGVMGGVRGWKAEKPGLEYGGGGGGRSRLGQTWGQCTDLLRVAKWGVDGEGGGEEVLCLVDNNG